MNTIQPILLQETHPGGIRVLRLNRPQSYNALSRELVDYLRDAVARVAADQTRVMILAAAEPGFCAGADLKQRHMMTEQEKYIHNRAINALANEIAALPLPTIAAINGVAMGGGCELALACDLRFASSHARIGLTETRIGAIPGAGGTQRLPRLIGSSRALELMYMGETVSAGRAVEIGLINHCVEPDQLDAKVLDCAARIAEKSRHAVATLKATVQKGLDISLENGLELEGAAIIGILNSDDYREGLAAFAEKRKPNFQ